MAQFGNKVKLTVLKGMEAIGQGASNLASNAQQRLQELNLDNQRRELLNAFPLKAYELWQKGESLPQPLEEMLKELKDVLLIRVLLKILYSSLWAVYVQVWDIVEQKLLRSLKKQADSLRFLLHLLRNLIHMIFISQKKLRTIA